MLKHNYVNNLSNIDSLLNEIGFREINFYPIPKNPGVYMTRLYINGIIIGYASPYQECQHKLHQVLIKESMLKVNDW